MTATQKHAFSEPRNSITSTQLAQLRERAGALRMSESEALMFGSLEAGTAAVPTFEMLQREDAERLIRALTIVQLEVML